MTDHLNRRAKELLEEDIPTLQEYLGYCLVPTTRVQKILVISGKGGQLVCCL